MGKKQCLNQKRLTKKQVKEIIETEGKLHQEFTFFFERTYSTGHKDQPLVYELPNDRFLYIFDPNGLLLAGKGDIYAKDYFLRWMRWVQKVRDNSANGRNSSVAHWRYYSKHKSELIHKIDQLIEELAEKLEIIPSKLDFSYLSLDVVSSQADNYGLERVQSELYDNLVAYVGEILRRRVDGKWDIDDSVKDQTYPCISKNNNAVLMPINVVWEEIDGLQPMNLRTRTTNEIRRFSLRHGKI
ncbi:MAG: hypothetical protein ABI417_00355 [Coleofasciculaceae cyanobacterium]